MTDTEKKYPPKVKLFYNGFHVSVNHYGVKDFGEYEVEYLSIQEHLDLLAEARAEVWEECIKAMYAAQDSELEFEEWMLSQSERTKMKP